MGWLGLFLIVLNAFLPAMVPATPGPETIPGLSIGANSDNQIVICTPTGLRIIKVDADGNPLRQQDRTRAGFSPFCVPFAHVSGGALAALDVVLPLPDVEATELATVRRPDEQIPHHPERDHAHPRAPPVISLG